MRFMLRKFVDADNAAQALKLDRKTPVHEVYLKDGEEPRRTSGDSCHAVGFWHPEEPSYGFTNEPRLCNSPYRTGDEMAKPKKAPMPMKPKKKGC